MTCGDCSDDGSACITCNTGYELSGTKCTVITPPDDGPLGGVGGSWLWWVIGIVVVCLLLVGIAWFVMKKGHKEGSMHDDNIEMHHDTDQHGTHY